VDVPVQIHRHGSRHTASPRGVGEKVSSALRTSRETAQLVCFSFRVQSEISYGKPIAMFSSSLGSWSLPE